LSAHAAATKGQATASAILDQGIRQLATATAGAASDRLGNDGTIAIDLVAEAAAAAGSAFASATLQSGIAQTAFATLVFSSVNGSEGGTTTRTGQISKGPASVTLTNNGTIDFGVSAEAQGA